MQVLVDNKFFYQLIPGFYALEHTDREYNLDVFIMIMLIYPRQFML